MSPEDELVLFRRTPSRLRRRPLQAFARMLCDTLSPKREFICLVTDDRELKRLNREFRGANYATDVLSFPSEDEMFLGEMAISANRASAQAREFGHSIDDEIRILMLHGALHLLGMDHETDHGEMAHAESRWRKKLSLPTGLIARAS